MENKKVKKSKKGLFSMIKESFNQKGCGCAGVCGPEDSIEKDAKDTDKNTNKSK
jgi:hypothetical protein